MTPSVPLHLNYSTHRIKPAAALPKVREHYECFKPQLFSVKELHHRGFTPVVYTRAADRKKAWCKAGYRSKENVIGLTNVGYVDIDEPKLSDGEYLRQLTTGSFLGKPVQPATENLQLPTYESLHDVFSSLGFWHYIHPSASRGEGKFRVVYRRGITVHSPAAYSPVTDEWMIDRDVLTEVDPALTVAMVTFDEDLHTGGARTVETPGDLRSSILGLLQTELSRLREWLAPYMNISGLDATSGALHMHSKHLTAPPDLPMDYPLHELTGDGPERRNGCVTVWRGGE